MIYKYFFLIGWINLSLWSCKSNNKESAFPTKLSEWNFFKDLPNLIPNEKVFAYDIQTPLFSDYAEKLRFIYLPEGSKIHYNDSSYFHFDDHSVIIKNFFYYEDVNNPGKGKRLIETRLLVKKQGKWIPLTYQWNEQQTDAEIVFSGNYIPIKWKNQQGDFQNIQYRIPNLNQCKSCHENQNILQPIGIKAKHLNKNFIYSHGEENQLTYWSKNEFLVGLPNHGSIPQIANFMDSSKSINERARAWLDINCAHCHNPSGPAATSGLYLHSEETNPVHLGILKSPVAAGKGTGGLDFDILPGKPEQSILFYRLKTNEPGERMPELGRTIVHKESLQLIEEWIKNLPINSSKNIN